MAGPMNEIFFSMVWKVDNFNSSIKRKNYISPYFFISHMQNSSEGWQLCVKRTGINVSVLRICDCNFSLSFDVDVELSCLDSDGCVIYGKEFRNQKSHILHKKCFLPLQNSSTLRTLTVQCKFLRFIGEIPLQSESVFACTTFKEKRLSFVWTIKDFSSLSPHQTSVINIDFAKDQEDEFEQTLKLKLFSDHKSTIFVEYCLDFKISTNVYSTFQACILDSLSQAVDSVIHSRYIKSTDLSSGKTLRFAFSKPMLARKKEQYLPGDVFSLRCESVIYKTAEYVFSYETPEYIYTSFTFSETDSQCPNSNPYTCGTTRGKSCFANQTLKKMFEDNICSDYTLWSGSKSFPVHRAVLCCRSPVFRAMFTTDMKEARSESMQLPNVDSNTLTRFIKFLYKEELDAGLNWEDVSKLYSLADQYDVMSLINRCRSLLNCRIINANACKILALADAHQDKSLRSVVARYIKKHFDDIANTEEWNEFVSENECLAQQVLTDL